MSTLENTELKRYYVTFIHKDNSEDFVTVHAINEDHARSQTLEMPSCDEVLSVELDNE